MPPVGRGLAPAALLGLDSLQRGHMECPPYDVSGNIVGHHQTCRGDTIGRPPTQQKPESVGEGSPLPLLGAYTLPLVGRGLAPAASLKLDSLQRGHMECPPTTFPETSRTPPKPVGATIGRPAILHSLRRGGFHIRPLLWILISITRRVLAPCPAGKQNIFHNVRTTPGRGRRHDAPQGHPAQCSHKPKGSLV